MILLPAWLKNKDKWPYAQLYFFHFSVMGAMLPYLSLYLHYLEFDSVEIGIIISTPMLVRIVIPNVWGHLADVSLSRVTLLRIGLSLSCFTFIALLFVDHFFTVLGCLVFNSLFWNGMLPLTEAEVIERLRHQSSAYGRVRAWGSIGFIVAVLSLGFAFDHISIRHFPPIVLTLLGLTALSSLVIQNGERVERQARVSMKAFFTEFLDAKTFVFFLVIVLVHVSHGGYYAFFSIYLEELGYSRTETGVLWVLGVLIEIGLFFVSHRIIPRFSLFFLLVLSLVFTGLRWVLTGLFSEFVLLLIVAQSLHAFSFGVVHLVSVEYCRKSFSAVTLSRAQALISATSFGMGGAAGTFLSGYVWPLGGQMLFLGSASVTLVAIALCFIFLRKCPTLGLAKPVP